jgi:hypothetical protein
MRRFSIGCCLLLSTVVLAVPGFAGAQTPGTTDPLKTSKTIPTADDWYNSSVILLKRGQKFNRVATQLHKAIALRDQMKYHVALGCAFAGRAASLAQATVDRTQFAADQAKYEGWLTAWKAAQKDPGSLDNGKPRPEAPVLLTKDDQLPFILTREEAVRQFKTLVEDAMAEWDAALSRVKTDQERAELDYVRGWGMELLRVYGERANWKDLPRAPENTKLLLEATKLAPKNAVYWQSLGDLRMDLSADIGSGRDKPGALVAYRQALKLKQTNANLWYRIYDLCKHDDPEQAKEALRQAVQTDADNAYPAYRLAGLLFSETPYSNSVKEFARARRENDVLSPDTFRAISKQISDAPDYAKMRQAAEAALAEVENGNRANRYVAPVYDPPFPALLRAAWYFKGNSFNATLDVRDWQTISVSTGDYITVTVQKGDEEAAAHASHILRDMGIKIAGDLYDKPIPLPKAELQRLMIGFSIVRTGYEYLLGAYKEAGDSASAAQLDPEYRAFDAQYKQYMEAAIKARQNSYGEF